MYKMMERVIKIQDILSIRGGSIEEICDYAKQRGINLPYNANHILSVEELVAIDPLLAVAIMKEKKRDVQQFESFKKKSDDEILDYLSGRLNL